MKIKLSTSQLANTRVTVQTRPSGLAQSLRTTRRLCSPVGKVIEAFPGQAGPTRYPKPLSQSTFILPTSINFKFKLQMNFYMWNDILIRALDFNQLSMIKYALENMINDLTSDEPLET